MIDDQIRHLKSKEILKAEQYGCDLVLDYIKTFTDDGVSHEKAIMNAWTAWHSEST